ncbi:MAG: tRNA lysidine(34) synthetase TilS [Syntrophomonadaceae bacterium]
MLVNKVERFIAKHRLVKPGDKVLLAVSGGPDSMCLLHLLHNLGPKLDLEMAAVHLNHGLRAEAGSEEALVREHCRRLGLACYSRKVQVDHLAREWKTSLEDAGRRARYSYFAEVAQDLDFSRIATAHHYDDVAETVLLHLMRGSGIRGLRGIMPLNGQLIRPLLGVTKAEILAYAEEMDISYCLDPSNTYKEFIRNRIRHHLIPYLQQEYNPRIVEALNNLAVIAQAEDEAIENEIERHWPGLCLEEQPGMLVLSLKAWADLHLAYKRRIVHRALKRMSAQAPWSLGDVEKVMGLESKSGSSCTLHLKKGVRITRGYDRIIFTTQTALKTEFREQVSIPGEIRIPQVGIILGLARVEREHYQPRPGDMVLDLDRLPGKLWLRSRQAGDFFRPLGMQGSKKLKKWFIDHKIPAADRGRTPLLAGDDTEIYAIWGHAVSRLAAVDQGTVNLLVISRCAD